MIKKNNQISVIVNNRERKGEVIQFLSEMKNVSVGIKRPSLEAQSHFTGLSVRRLPFDSIADQKKRLQFSYYIGGKTSSGRARKFRTLFRIEIHKKY